MLGRVVTFVAGGWLAMSAFAWPQSDLACANTCIGGVLCIVYGLLSVFHAQARILNTVHACLFCVVSLSLDASSVARANNVMLAAVVFGASLMSWPELPRFVYGARACSVDGSNASSTGLPISPGGGA